MNSISCDLYDYIEIACTFKIPVSLLLESGEELNGVPIDTSVKSDKTETLVFRLLESHKTIEIPMNTMIKMSALEENMHFKEVLFNHKDS